MVKVRFLKSVHGAYGEANQGDEKEVSKTLAHELTTSGIAEMADGEEEKSTSDEGDKPSDATGAEPKAITSESFETNSPADPEKLEEERTEDYSPQARRAARRRQAD